MGMMDGGGGVCAEAVMCAMVVTMEGVGAWAGSTGPCPQLGA